MTIKPWKVLGSKQLYKNIRIDQCELPDGRVYDVPVHEYHDWVTIVALTNDGQVVLEQQYRHGLQRTILELPGGTMDPEDESPLSAARRELVEETGYTSDRFFQVGCLSPNPASNNNWNYSFLALDAEKTDDQHLDETEELDVVLKPLSEVIELAKKGELPQSLHVSTLFFALAYLDRIK